MMHAVTDMAAMELYEQACELPVDQREDWLVRQPAAPAVIEHARRLLRAESHVGDFLDTAVHSPATLIEGPAFPNIGDRLGPWELLRPLAAGGMGVVYLARRADDVYHQEVAIKLIRAVHMYGDAAARAMLISRFESERVILAQLDHPNIARILDGGSTEAGVPYLVMERVDGQPLDDYCRNQKLDVPARLKLFCKLCDGVQEAHRNLIVHRDIKPDNVLVASNGEPRLIDFGIARELSAGLDVGQTGASLYSAMTPAYASPEQVRHEALSTSSDVYSLGVVLFQLLAGKRPYELAGLSPAAIERTVSDSPSVSVRQALQDTKLDATMRRRHAQQIDDDLERIVAKALHKESARRYPSADALAQDLRRYLAGQPVLAHPDSRWYRSRKFVRRHRLGVSLASLAVLAVLMAAVMAWHQALVAERAMADTQRANAFLIDVLNLSDPYGSGGDLSMAEAIQRADVMVDDKFSDRPETAMDLHLTLSEALLHAGRVEQANTQLDALVERSQTRFGEDDQRTLKAMVLQASARRELGRYAEAERIYQGALLRIERSQWRDDGLHARALNDLGLLYLAQEQRPQAADVLRRAIVLDQHSDSPVDPFAHAQTLANLAQALSGQGKYDEADALYSQAQAVFADVYSKGSTQEAIVLNNRATLARRRNLPEQALALQHKAVEMHRALHRGDHAMVLVPTINLARQYVDLGRGKEAMPYAIAAEAMAARLYPQGHNYRIQAILALADAQRATGEYTQAEAGIRQAQALLEKTEVPPSIREYLDVVLSDLCHSAPTLHSCSPPTGS